MNPPLQRVALRPALELSRQTFRATPETLGATRNHSPPSTTAKPMRRQLPDPSTYATEAARRRSSARAPQLPSLLWAQTLCVPPAPTCPCLRHSVPRKTHSTTPRLARDSPPNARRQLPQGQTPNQVAPLLRVCQTSPRARHL